MKTAGKLMTESWHTGRTQTRIGFRRRVPGDPLSPVGMQKSVFTSACGMKVEKLQIWESGCGLRSKSESETGTEANSRISQLVPMKSVQAWSCGFNRGTSSIFKNRRNLRSACDVTPSNQKTIHWLQDGDPAFGGRRGETSSAPIDLGQKEESMARPAR